MITELERKAILEVINLLNNKDLDSYNISGKFYSHVKEIFKDDKESLSKINSSSFYSISNNSKIIENAISWLKCIVENK